MPADDPKPGKYEIAITGADCAAQPAPYRDQGVLWMPCRFFDVSSLPMDDTDDMGGVHIRLAAGHAGLFVRLHPENALAIAHQIIAAAQDLTGERSHAKH